MLIEYTYYFKEVLLFAYLFVSNPQSKYQSICLIKLNIYFLDDDN